MDIALDPIGYSQALQDAGMPREQADVIARTQQPNIEKIVADRKLADSNDLKNLATKAELKELDSGMRSEMAALRVDVSGLRGDVDGLRKDISLMDVSLNAKIDGLRKDMTQIDASLHAEIDSLRKDMSQMDTSLRKDMSQMDTSLRAEIDGLRKDMAQMETRLDARIQKSMHDILRWTIVMNISAVAAIAGLFALLK